eukprot:gene14108-biopygen10444
MRARMRARTCAHGYVQGGGMAYQVQFSSVPTHSVHRQELMHARPGRWQGMFSQSVHPCTHVRKDVHAWMRVEMRARRQAACACGCKPHARADARGEACGYACWNCVLWLRPLVTVGPQLQLCASSWVLCSVPYGGMSLGIGIREAERPDNKGIDRNHKIAAYRRTSTEPLNSQRDLRLGNTNRKGRGWSTLDLWGDGGRSHNEDNREERHERMRGDLP